MKVEKIFLLFLFFSLSCVDEAPRQTLPFAPVYFKIDINGADYRLNSALSATVYTNQNRRTPHDRFGFGGLLVVRDAQASTVHVYDAACPHEHDATIQVVPDGKGEAVCPMCHSVYVTMYGAGDVKSGVSKSQLQKYCAIPQNRAGEFILINCR